MKTREELNQMNSTEVRKEAGRNGIKNYTKYSKLELIDMILQNQPAQVVVIEEKTEKAPRTGSKSEKILAELRKGGKSMYRIAKDLETYVPFVLAVKRKYVR